MSLRFQVAMNRGQTTVVDWREMVAKHAAEEEAEDDEEFDEDDLDQEEGEEVKWSEEKEIFNLFFFCLNQTKMFGLFNYK